MSRGRVIRLVFSSLFGVIIAIAIVRRMPKPLPELTRRELIEEAQAGNVHEVVIIDGEVATGESSRKGPFRVMLPHAGDDKSLTLELSAMGVEVKFEKGSDLIP